jgi:hypothetical protein
MIEKRGGSERGKSANPELTARRSECDQLLAFNDQQIRGITNEANRLADEGGDPEAQLDLVPDLLDLQKRQTMLLGDALWVDTLRLLGVSEEMVVKAWDQKTEIHNAINEKSRERYEGGK